MDFTFCSQEVKLFIYGTCKFKLSCRGRLLCRESAGQKSVVSGKSDEERLCKTGESSSFFKTEFKIRPQNQPKINIRRCFAWDPCCMSESLDLPSTSLSTAGEMAALSWDGVRLLHLNKHFPSTSRPCAEPPAHSPHSKHQTNVDPVCCLSETAPAELGSEHSVR